METRDILKNLREKSNLTQEELADRIHVTRQAISRWETGETQPNTDTLKLLSQIFDVSVNTLLGSPRQLICQCCGMPFDEDGVISQEPDGSYNEDYCRWCYTDGNLLISQKNLCWIIWKKICQILIMQTKKPDAFSLIRIFHS